MLRDQFSLFIKKYEQKKKRGQNKDANKKLNKIASTGFLPKLKLQQTSGALLWKGEYTHIFSYMSYWQLL